MAMLEVTGLAKAFGGLNAVDGVDLRVEAGEKRAVIGPNGAGKTTLFNLLTGFIRPDRGQVTVGGKTPTGRPTHEISRAGIGRAFQITSIFPRLTVFENVQLGILSQRGESARIVGRVKNRYAEQVG